MKKVIMITILLLGSVCMFGCENDVEPSTPPYKKVFNFPSDRPIDVGASWDGKKGCMIVSWKDVSNTDDVYRIQYSLNGGDWDLAGTTPINETRISINYSCSNIDSYVFRIRWENIDSNYKSDWSENTSSKIALCLD